MRNVKEMIPKDEALKLIGKTSRHTHSLMVSAIMGKLAKRLGKDKEKWEIVGLLHDLDYDQVKDDMSKHGIRASEILMGKLPEDCLYAIKSHDYRTGFMPQSKLDKALIIADSLVSVIEKIKVLSIKEVERELNRVSTNEPYLKKNIMRCDEIGISYSELLKLGLSACMQIEEH